MPPGIAMTTAELTFAILALLMTPGPTNTLLFLGGAAGGLRAALRLVPAELAGYLLAVVPLALFGAPLLQALPGAQAMIALAAGLWVAWLAFRLWAQPPGQAQAFRIGARAVLVTTLLNPKALIFGLVLLPAAPQMTTGIALFAALVAGVAVLWGAAGAWAGGRGPAGRGATDLPILRRAAALWLGALSLGLVLRGSGLA